MRYPQSGRRQFSTSWQGSVLDPIRSLYADDMTYPGHPSRRRASRHKDSGADRWALSIPALLAVAALVGALLAWGVITMLAGKDERAFETEEALLAAIGADSADLATGPQSQAAALPLGTGASPGERGSGNEELGGAEPGSAGPGGIEQVVVYVSGEVLRPGVVTLAPGSRVVEALELAGGPGPKASLEGTNLARELADGEQIHIPAAGENGAEYQPAAKDVAPGTDGSRGPSVADDGRTCIDINAASAAELEALPGIGPTLSARIVEYRETNGSYQQNADLRQVTGIGSKVYAGLEADLCEPG